mgnify:CR=1 FL=1
METWFLYQSNVNIQNFVNILTGFFSYPIFKPFLNNFLTCYHILAATLFRSKKNVILVDSGDQCFSTFLVSYFRGKPTSKYACTVSVYNDHGGGPVYLGRRWLWVLPVKRELYQRHTGLYNKIPAN